MYAQCFCFVCFSQITDSIFGFSLLLNLSGYQLHSCTFMHNGEAKLNNDILIQLSYTFLMFWGQIFMTCEQCDLFWTIQIPNTKITFDAGYT